MTRSLPTYIRTFRKREGLSQDEVAFLLGNTSGTIVLRHEDGQRAPTLDAALGYAAIFRTDARELFAGRYEAVEETVRRQAALLLATAKEQLPTPEVEKRIAFLSSLIADPEPRWIPCDDEQ